MITCARPTGYLGNRKGAFIFMNGSLDDVAGLEVYINCSPDLIGAPSGIAATGVKLCIGQAYYNDFKEHYSWSALADFMQKFDAPAQDDENGGAIETPIVDIPAK